MDVDAVADELYGLDPSDFVTARTSFVQQARSAKERDAARAIAGLKKPTTVGWLVNLLSRELPDELGTVLALGDALQRAQRRLDAEALRELTQRRQRLVNALASKAGALAGGRGRVVNDAALREVSQTLNAAMADPLLAETVRRGRVLAAASYSGFGPAGLESVDVGEDESDEETAGAAPGGAPARSERRARDREDALARARAELRSAREEAHRARTVLSGAEKQLGEIRSEAAEAEDGVRALRCELDHLEERVEFLARSEANAVQSVSTARTDVDRLDQLVAEAEGIVSGLDRR
ncbi:hypothetical protein [Rhodococcus sp. ACT016]|uniref:hypothetical protein n=1 Tax=Rhodococcus sp. ACT016 TaxID=3134808 RepID=UPI003D29173A